METSYCLFKVNNHLSAINTVFLGEVFALPEIILVPNAPSGIVGVMDVRGDVLPVVDLRPISEGESLRYSLTDSVIILEQGELAIGLIVNSVQDIRELSLQGVMTEISTEQEWLNPNVREFFTGMVLNEDEIFILDEPQTWFNPGELQQIITITRFLVDDFYGGQLGQSESPLSENDITITFCAEASDQEKSIFRQRAENLRRPLQDDEEGLASTTLIVVALDNELLGIEATAVREFITIEQATPVPCCPRYIIGSTNLRGETLTILDISEPLGISPKPLTRKPKAVVIELEDTLTAIVVEEIRDALFDIKLNSIQPGQNQNNYLDGTVPYGTQMMNIINLPKLLNSEELVINEAI
ncbi:MAG: chemotaxis protein CheW [Cyanobacteria bacterium P01_C01_bin.118]